MSGRKLIVIYLNWFKDVNWFLSSFFHFKTVYLGLTFRFTFFIPIILLKDEGSDWFETSYLNHLTVAWKSGL